MHQVDTGHPPGGVIFLSPEVGRYPEAFDALEALFIPRGSLYIPRKGPMVSENLNDAIRDALSAHTRGVVPAPLEWVWLMGDDHFYAPDVLLRLIDRDRDVVCPLCLNRAPPFWPTIHKHGRNKPLHELPTRGLYELGEGETCGDAGMLIRRRVLEAIGDPWYDRPACGKFAVDDQLFTGRLKEAGFGIAWDMDVQIGHITPASIFPVVKNGAWTAQIGTCDRTFISVDMRWANGRAPS